MVQPNYYNAVLIAASCLPIFLHTSGLILLRRTRAGHKNKSHWLLLVNLSVAELLFAWLGLTTSLLDIISMETPAFKLRVCHYIGVTLAYFFVIILITIERFLEVYLNIKYPLYWTATYTQCSLFAMWFLCIASTLAALMYPNFDETALRHLCYLYIFPSVEILFVLIGSFVYSYVFVKLRFKSPTVNRQIACIRSVVSEAPLPGLSAHTKRYHHRQLKSFVMPSLFVLTFVLFAVVPDQLHFYALLMDTRIPHSVVFVVQLCYNFAMSSDALVYVMLSPPLRDFMKRKLRLNGKDYY